MSLLEQMPRLSAYDPGAVGEGGLDPLGFAALADRVAELLAPGVRARMSQPRFVTLSAVGAIAYQSLHELTADEGKTTVDIAFEWLVVEAMVRHPDGGRSEGLPGNQKASRAKAMGERLSRRTYLNGPRVFGFTGVYRPLSRNVGVLTLDDLPAEHAARLVGAWERDFDLAGYIDGISGSPGGQLRKRLADACCRTLEQAECAAPPTGQLLRDLSDYLAPRQAQASERRVLRELITTGEHEPRNELTAKLAASPPAADTSQRDLALQLQPGTSRATRQVLQAAIDYEDAATAIDNTFRHLLAYTAQQHGSVISLAEASQAPGLLKLAPRVGGLVDRAIAAVTALDDVALSTETVQALRLFAGRQTPADLLAAFVERHHEVQAGKGKLSWLDQIQGDWTVRTPYRDQILDPDDLVWTHQMRLVTLANLLTGTAP